MRSVVSPRAVSIRIGTSESARTRRQTSKPSRSGSMTSRTSASKACAFSAARPSAAVSRTVAREARLAEVLAHHRAEARVVVDDEDAVGHSRQAACGSRLIQATATPMITIAITSNTICFATTAPGIGCTA